MCFELALAVAWLISPCFISMRRLALLPLLFIMLGVGVVGMLANFAVPFSFETLPVLMMSCVAFGAALGIVTLGLVVTGFAYRRKQYRAGHFMVTYGFAMMLIGLLLALPVVALSVIPSIMMGNASYLLVASGSLLAFGLFGGLGLYILLIPFIVLTACNALYRQRFEAISGFGHASTECAPPTSPEGHTNASL
jgi:hypothetical protein